MGKDFPPLLRCRDRKSLRKAIERKEIQKVLKRLEELGLRAGDFLMDLLATLGSQRFAKGLSLVSEGLAFNAFCVAPALIEAGFKVYLEPYLIHYGKTFDLLAEPRAAGVPTRAALHLVEVKRIVKIERRKRLLYKAEIDSFCLQLLLDKIIPVFSVQGNLGDIQVDLLLIAARKVSRTLRDHCASLSEELSRALQNLRVEGFKIQACHYREMGRVARMLGSLSS
ncbi:MAG: hypothetical protein DRJ67_11010 [Thermoprotei archaeon]|nr:MAG: hypothetical protein DRJ67_11010 [Thermoprotei archaeon]